VKVCCRACFRVEDRSVTPPVVVAEGGSRRVIAPEWAAFTTLAASLDGELGAVVGSCPRCGQPLVEGDAPRSSTRPQVPWRMGTADEELVLELDGQFRLNGSPVAREAARDWVHRHFPGPETERRGGGLGMVQAVMLALMVAPILVWVFSVTFVSVFLYRFPESPP
jgi:hypothetical protein